MKNTKNPFQQLNKTKRSRYSKSHLRRRLLRLECLETRKLLAGPNDPPVNVIPAEVSTFVNTPVSFTEYRGNQISTTDSDGDLSEIQVTLSASRGTVSLIGPYPISNLAFSAGDGKNDGTLIFSGPLADVNSALNWVVFYPETDYVGSEASLLVIADDMGNSGAPALFDTDVIVVEVLAAPVFDPSPNWSTVPGELDSSFDDDGIALFAATSGIDFIHDVHILPDGKILATGSVNDHLGIYRFSPDLTPDLNFGLGGFIEHDFGDGVHANSMTLDPQGRILIGSKDLVLRFTPDGYLDLSFATGGKAQDPFNSSSGYSARLVTDIDVRADGAIIVVGGDPDKNRGDKFQIACILDSGTIQWRQEHDVFTNDPTANELYHSRDLSTNLILRSDGTMLVIGKGGENIEFVESRQLTFLELDQMGDRISEVSVPSAMHFPNDVLPLPDGKLIIIGNDVVPNGSRDPFVLNDYIATRHLPDGSLDNSFGQNGVARIPVLNDKDWSYTASLQNDGKILIAGQSYTDNKGWELSMVRLTQDGALDPTFDGDGKLSLSITDHDDFTFAVQVLPYGKILLAGRSADDVVMVRLSGDSIQNHGENQAPINVLPLSASTRVDMPLAFTAHQGNAISVTDADAGLGNVEVTLTGSKGTISLVHPNPSGELYYSVGDGTDDSQMTFNGRLSEVNMALQWVVFTPDSGYIGTDASLVVETNDLGNSGTGGAKSDHDLIEIEIAANFSFEDSPTWVVTPGVLDEQFDADGIQQLPLSTGVDFISQMKITDSGDIVSTGAINNHFGFMKFKSDLTLDTSFGTNGFTETDIGDGRHAWDMIEHPHGGWLVSGAEALVRYTTSGFLDPSFGTGGIVTNQHFDRGTSVSITADGVILVTGTTAGQFHLSRYTLDGELLSNWEQIAGQRAIGAFPRPNGDIVLAGGDDGYQSARVNVRGTLQDAGSLSGPGAVANRSLLLPDGKFLIVGERDGHILAGRFHPDGTPDVGFGFNGTTELPTLATSDSAIGASLQHDGKLLIVGHTGIDHLDVAIVRLSYDGIPDPTFDADGILQIPASNNDDAGYAVVQLADGRILIGGRSQDDILLAALLGDTNILANANNPPTLDFLPDLVVDNETISRVVDLEGITAGGEIQAVRVSTTSNDTGLIPQPTVSYVYPDTTGTLTFSVTPDQVGSAMITVTAEDSGPDGNFDSTDDNRTFSRDFQVTVTQFHAPPAMDAIPDQEVERDAAEQTVNLSGITNGNAVSQPISITAFSSDTALIPNPVTSYTVGEENGSLRFTPVPGQVGTATITVQLEDGGLDEDLATSGDNGNSTYTFDVAVFIRNAQPTLDQLSSFSVLEDSGLNTITLSGISSGIGESQILQVTAMTNNSELLTEPTVSYSQGDSTATLSFTPFPDSHGIAAINVIVEDGGHDHDLATTDDNATIIRAFGVEVVAVNDAPYFDLLSDVNLNEDAPEQVVYLTGIHAGGYESQEVMLSASSSNTDVVSDPQLTFETGDSEGLLHFMPVPFNSGTTTITVVLEDSGSDGNMETKADNAVFSRSFTINVNAVNDVPTLGQIADVAVDIESSDHLIGLIDISAGDNETQAIRVMATSSESSVIPNPSILYSPDDTTGLLTLATAGLSAGETTITVSVEDAGLDGDLSTIVDNAIFSRSFQVSVGGAGFIVEDGVLRLTIRDPNETVRLVEVPQGIEFHLSDGVWFGQDETGGTGSGNQQLLLDEDHPFDRIELRGSLQGAMEFDDRDSWRPEALLVSPQVNLRSIRNLSKDISVHLEWPTLWQNPINVSDIDGDGVTSTKDALLLINQIARSSPISQRILLQNETPTWPSYFLDPNGDNELTILDALYVLNRLQTTIDNVNAESESVDAVMLSWQRTERDNGRPVPDVFADQDSLTTTKAKTISFVPIDEAKRSPVSNADTLDKTADGEEGKRYLPKIDASVTTLFD